MRLTDAQKQGTADAVATWRAWTKIERDMILKMFIEATYPNTTTQNS